MGKKAPAADAGGEAPEGALRKITLAGGVALIVGSIIGSGIFVSPSNVFAKTESVGFSLVIWTLSGVFSCLGALCYAELGTVVNRSGGEYAYLTAALGPLPGFLQLWASLVILQPTPLAVMARTFAVYTAKPFFEGCEPPEAVVKLLAIVGLGLLTAVNSTSVRLAMRVQGVFTWAKILALVLFIILGAVTAFSDGVDNLSPAWEGTFSPGAVAMASYFGLFAFGGWNQLNFVIDELQDPYRNLPKAICLAVPMVTLVYVLVNAAYFIVLTKSEMLSSFAVAVLFSSKTMPLVPWLVPLFVSLSCFGSINGILFTSSRLFEAGAQNGHLPSVLALRHVHKHTPAPALVITGLLAGIMVVLADVNTLIEYMSQVLWFFVALSVIGMLVLRWKQPHVPRPIRVPLVVPITFLVVCLSIVVIGAWAMPWQTAMGLLITLSGIPVYFIGVVWTKPLWMRRFEVCLTKRLQCILLVGE
ncbi:large neutral amino acids transporter small subunit 1-like [Frankliniella occidentalis]|uniref:Large neutral amino acids transporter small subunit 1-like n=1 Tax=Frankliniella occidentalis TaxID=133901 RepID=A0A9C6XVH9_FRAOC|nr:large neutral amino acids transporter small subunit 1-like [Frankliniella occidentalis]XP_052132898.1 large neutral amino acids transporter small subunit 1-like [Frankliniella occidentalis]XP_052132899.1 large neutral amino acids transporter small subunit 1-like [Frankliniella occidentalis]